MLVNIDVEFPQPPENMDEAAMRAGFRKTVENRVRPRMDNLVDRIRQVARYQKIAGAYELEQKSTADSVAFAVVNTNEHARFLIGGSRAHMIPHAFGRPGAVRHPGIKPDQPVLDQIEAAQDDILAAAEDGADTWVRNFGQGG